MQMILKNAYQDNFAEKMILRKNSKMLYGPRARNY